MKMTQQQIDRLLAGKTVQVVVPKKEGELNGYHGKAKDTIGYIKIKNGKCYGRLKWKIGRDYAIRKPGLWYCPKCKIWSETDFQVEKHYEWWDVDDYCGENLIPLRFVVKSIKSQRLLDLTEENAKKGGYQCKLQFLRHYLVDHKKSYKCDYKLFETRGILFSWNPEVWVFGGVKA